MQLDYVDIKEKKSKGQLEAEKKNEELQKRLDELDSKFDKVIKEQSATPQK